jgi:hypothetical protein
MQNHPTRSHGQNKLPHGIHLDRISRDSDLADGLRADDMERFAAVPKTVMINAWLCAC